VFRIKPLNFLIKTSLLLSLELRHDFFKPLEALFRSFAVDQRCDLDPAFLGGHRGWHRLHALLHLFLLLVRPSSYRLRGLLPFYSRWLLHLHVLRHRNPRQLLLLRRLVSLIELPLLCDFLRFFNAVLLRFATEQRDCGPPLFGTRGKLHDAFGKQSDLLFGPAGLHISVFLFFFLLLHL
jgi:hypothetical protein